MLSELVNKAVKQVTKDLGLKEIEFTVEHPEEMGHGDYACNVAMVGFKQVKDKYKSPKEASKHLGITVRTVFRMINRYEIDWRLTDINEDEL